MTNSQESLARRLCEVESPQGQDKWNENDGYYVATCRVSKDDVPGLIEIARKWGDPNWKGEDLGLDGKPSDIEWLPVTAWRALADLKSSECVEPLIHMLVRLGADCDWEMSEFPHVFGKIGRPAMSALFELAADRHQPDEVRGIAVDGLRCVAEYYAETRHEVVVGLTEFMARAADDSVPFNSKVLSGLVDLRVTEAAELIERAFANNHLDTGLLGDWEYVRKQLGVEGLGLEMPTRPYNSIERLRQRMGIGIFSDRVIFEDGGCNPDAEQAYYEQARTDFSKSREADQVVARFGELNWAQSLLKYSIEYRSEIIDEVTQYGLEEYVFEYIPRKVSTQPDRAAWIIFELTMFFEYLERAFDLPNAREILEWLRLDCMVSELETELADSSNYGLAKSIVMAGMAAGYDMTSQEGAAQFMEAHNRSLHQWIGPESPWASDTDYQKIGRNDPCPCGSGKKFKKCCLRS